MSTWGRLVTGTVVDASHRGVAVAVPGDVTWIVSVRRVVHDYIQPQEAPNA